MPLVSEPAVGLLQGYHTPFSPIVAQDPLHTRTLIHLSERPERSYTVPEDYMPYSI